MNRAALELIPGEKALAVLPGAPPLFDALRALEAMTEHARHWFLRHLARGG